MTTKLSESQIQSQCVTWLWNTYPQTRGLFFAVNNNSEHIARAMQRKSIGLVRGVSDTIFLWRHRAYLIEFKTPQGSLSESQKSWKAKMFQHGFNYFVVRSLDEFILVIEKILSENYD